ncbi:MAG: TraX family protein [Clostridia bacterium]|nr:TraX family protein [Clostridia bacterium]
MSSFVLKIVAIISMFIDHIGYVIFDKFSYFNYIGRLAFPIFAFQISEGYVHTKNLKKYFVRLLIFALVSQIPFMLFHNLFFTRFTLNIFFTLLLGLACIFIYDKLTNKLIAIIASICIGIFANYFHCDYGFYGVAIILLFYIFKNKKLYMVSSFIIATGINYLISILNNGYNDAYLYLFLATSLSIIPLLFYNGKKGKNTKYFLYLFYPIHLLFIYFIYIWGI